MEKEKERGQRLKDRRFIFYLSQRKVVLSRGMHRKSSGKGRGVFHSNSHISRFHQTCSMNPPDSRGPGLEFREPHRTCSVSWTSSVRDRIPEAPDRILETSTGLVRSVAGFQRLYAGL
jgi:hypothetical protein